MPINPNQITYLDKSLYTTTDKPIDAKFKIASLSDINDIAPTYVGHIFYSAQEDKHYKVSTVKNGYLVYATNSIVPTLPSGTEYVDYEVIPGYYFVDSYSEFTSGGGSDDEARLALNGLMPYISDFVEIDYSTSGFTNADLKIDNTTIPDFNDSVRLLYNIDVREVKEIKYVGADYMVLDSTGQAGYKAILGIKSDNSVHVLKDSTIITVNNTVTFSNVTIDVTDYDYISVCWSNIWNSTGILPTLTFLTNADPIYDSSVIEFVERTTFSTHKKTNDYIVLLDKNRYHEPAILSTPIIFTIGIEGNFGYQNIFKLKGQSVTIPPTVIMDRNSDDYEPTMWNTMYFYNEFGVVRLLIINSLS